MQKALIIILTFFVSLIFVFSCAKKEETADDSDTNSSTTSNYTCSGASTGSGPTFGNVTLEETTYLGTCFATDKYNFLVKNSSSVQVTYYSYSDNSSCTSSGTPTSTQDFCLESISVTSETVNKQTYFNDNHSIGDNVTGYYATAKNKHDGSNVHMHVAPINNSTFWYGFSSSKSNLESSAFIMKFTKQ